ncbi:MAG: hypothetical protein QOG75_3758 [Mycobacterium sp.]|nr:hypothetical protein [Mycobacterium sp.]
MASRQVARPHKRSEFELVFITRQAEKGWTDCLAVARNATVDAWDRLTTAPTVEDERLYRLRAELATGMYDGATFERYQYKITNGGRIWYFVQLTPSAKMEGRVLLERCEPGHPRQTDRPRKH